MQKHISFRTLSRCQKGLSLVEILITSGILGVVMLAILQVQTQQLKANAYIDFQLKRTQLSGSLTGQFLNNPENCKCLLPPGTVIPENPTSPGASVAIQTPPEIGPFNFVTPGVCSTASVGVPLVTTAGSNGIRLTSVALNNIMRTSGGNYTGELQLKIQSTKDVAGPRDLPINLRVAVGTAPSTPGSVQVNGCALSLASGVFTSESLTNDGYVEFPNGLLMQWGRRYIGPNSSLTIMYPRAFTQQPFSIQVSGTNDDSNDAQDNFPTAYDPTGAGSSPTGFTLRNYNDNIGDNITWFALGR